MKESNGRLERISQMERHFAEASSAVRKLTAALGHFEAALAQFRAAHEAVAILDGYYGSAAWREDLDADEAGVLPASLRRGVLSEDGIWNLLSECKELKHRVQQLADMAG